MTWTQLGPLASSTNNVIHPTLGTPGVALPPLVTIIGRAENDPLVLTIMDKAPARAFSWLEAPTSDFKFKTLYYATKQAL